jgi:hypothetical protein
MIENIKKASEFSSINRKKHTNSGQLWVHLGDARHIEERDKGLVRHRLQQKLAGARRIDDALQALDDRREDCLSSNL